MIATRLKAKLVLGILLILVFLLQVSPVISNSVYFGFDQGLDQLLVRRLVVDHKFSLVGRYSGLQGVLMGPLWTLGNSIPFIFSKGDPAANVLFWSFISLVFAGFFIHLIKRKIGVAIWPIVIFFLFSQTFIDAPRIVTSPNPLVFISPFLIYCLFEIVKNNGKRLLIVAWILIGIFFQLEIAFAIYTPILLLLTLIIFCGIKSLVNKYNLIGIFVFILSLGPQLIFDLRHNFLMTRGLLGFFLNTNNSLMTSNYSLFDRTISRIGSLIGDATLYALFPRVPILSIALAFLCLIGWILIWKGKPKLRLLLKLLLLTLAVFYVGFIFYPGTIWQWYRAGLPIVFILLVGIPLGYFWNKNFISKSISIGFCILFVFQSLSRFNFPLSLIKSEDNFVGSLGNQKRIIDYIYMQANGNDFNYYVYTPPVYDYIWQYDFIWYGQDKYVKLPSNWAMSVPLLGIGSQLKPPSLNTKDQLFLIIEPNRERPGESQFWRDSFIKIGDVISRKIFPGNIVVERRMIY
mgnify:CR=1 FL=1